MKTSLAIWVLLAACTSSDPADVEGTYNVSLTSRDNACNLDNWNSGSQATGISVAIAQDGSALTAEVGGGAGAVLGVWLGSNIFEGSVDEDEIDLVLYGQSSYNSGNCSFTYNAEISGTVNGDILTGKIEYRAATNNNPDCAALQGCVSFQDLNGTRPPT